jgi:hypothetical protein
MFYFSDHCHFDDCSSDSSKKIGHIRGDHDGSRWWTTYIPCHDELKTEDSKIEMNLVCSDIIKNLYPDGVDSILEKSIDFSTESKLSDSEFNFYIDGTVCDYWIRLIARRKDYNLYLHCFTK